MPELLALESLLVLADRELIRCHLDFGPDNVLLDTAGRSAVIDWENSGSESPEQELAMAALDFAVADDAAAVAFAEGYAAAGRAACVRDLGAFGTAIAVQGHLLEFLRPTGACRARLRRGSSALRLADRGDPRPTHHPRAPHRPPAADGGRGRRERLTA